MPDREKDDWALLQAGINILGEHFDSVQIFCTRHDMGGEGGTVAVSHGCGNWYARTGQIRRWLKEADKEPIEDPHA